MLMSPYLCLFFNVNLYFLLEPRAIVYMDHFFFVHSPVDGHFRCFQMLAMVNIAGVQDCQPVSFSFSSSEAIGPAVGMPD